MEMRMRIAMRIGTGMRVAIDIAQNQGGDRDGVRDEDGMG